MASIKHMEKLRSLAQLDVDAISAYEAALKGVRDDAVAAKLAGFRVDHARHVQDLNALLVKDGGQPVEMSPDLKGTVLQAMAKFSGALGIEAALLSLLANEELTNRAYDAAAKLDWDKETRALLEKSRAEEHGHLEWIKRALRERPWTRSAEVHP